MELTNENTDVFVILLGYRYYNLNNQLDATITNFIDNFSQLNMFRVIISPIFRRTGLCLQLVV